MKLFGPCLMIAVAGAFASVGPVAAQTSQPDATTPPAYNPPPSTVAPMYANDSIYYHDYRAQELSVDLFGAGTSGENRFDHDNRAYRWHHAHGGGGVGINYFFNRYFGVGADTLTEGLEPFIYSASGNLIGRFPIGETGLAPYVFAGGGYQFHDDREGFGQAGVGLEYRFARHLGVFVDGRGVILGEHRDYGLVRAGLRINF